MAISHNKQFGQNFLTDRKYAKMLLNAAEIGPEDTVVEVGAGAGMVTQFLVEEARRVISIEIDKRFVNLLHSRFRDFANLKIHDGDVMQFDPKKYGLMTGEYKLIGSLPYNISKQIIKKFLEESPQPESITVLIQKEVAEDYAAKPPKATFLSNYVELFGNCEYFETIPKEFFNPQPKVDGGIITIRNVELKIENYAKVVKFLKSGFLNPRKKLFNNLLAIYKPKKEELQQLFTGSEIDLNARASELQLDQWIKLSEVLTAKS